jgi:predicted phage terminase large subunit-like protein
MITEIELIRAKCLNNFSFFTRYFFKELNGKKFSVNSHHQVLFDECTLISQGQGTRTIFNVAPRYGKTEIVVKMFISWSIANNPKSRFIHLSYSDTLALDNSESIKDLIQSEQYQNLFPWVQIKKDSKAKDKWYTTDGGGVLARSASGQVTGFGAGQTNFDNDIIEFGGAIIIDDPIKPDDAESTTLREKVNFKFDSTIRNRVNSRDTPIIIIMQRLHSNDLCGYLIENEPTEWKVISMPVIKEDGTALWHEKHTIEELRHLEKVNEMVFQTQYMQNPTPREGLLFPKSDLSFQDFSVIDFKEEVGKLSYIDIADTGDDNHCVIIGSLFEKKIFIRDVLFTKLGTDTNVDLTAEILNRNNPQYVNVESNFGGGMYGQLLQPKLKNTIGLIPVRAKSNKHARITQMAGFIKMTCVFNSVYDPQSDYGKFIKNLTEYNKNGTVKHDDAPDCLEGLCKMALDFHLGYFDSIPSNLSAS